MIKTLIFMILLTPFSLLLAGESNSSEPKGETNSSIIEAELQKAIEQEKKFAKEQKFYDAKTYDFKGAEINKASLENVPLIEMDDPDLDSDAILGMSEEENLSW